MNKLYSLILILTSAVAHAAATMVPVQLVNFSNPYSSASLPVTLFGETAGTQFLASGQVSLTDASAHAGHGHAAFNFSSSPVGTGAIGATNADFAITASVLKKNFSASPTAGEVDGGYFVARNGGSNSDTAGILVDVGNYGTGFNASLEGVTSAMPSGTVTQQTDVQAGVVDTRTSNQYGFVASKFAGAGGYAFFAQQGGGGAGTGTWAHLMQFVGGGAVKFDMPIDGSNDVSMKLYDASNNSKTVRVNGNALSVLNSAGSTEIFNLSDGGSLTTSGGIGGVTNGSGGASGAVGENQLTSTTATSMTSGTSANCTSKSLAAGDWLVWGEVQFNPAASTTISSLYAGVSTTSATLPGSPQQGIVATFTTGNTQQISAPPTIQNISATTTVYLVGNSTFGTSTMTCNGYIYAIRYH